MNTLQKSILASAKKNLFAIRGVLGDRDTETILLQICKEEKAHRSWGNDFAKYHPIAPSVRNVAIVDLSRLWLQYSAEGDQIARESVHVIKLSHVLVWSACYLKSVRMESANFDYCVFITGEDK